MCDATCQGSLGQLVIEQPKILKYQLQEVGRDAREARRIKLGQCDGVCFYIFL